MLGPRRVGRPPCRVLTVSRLSQIRTSYGLHVDGYLRGDLIYFPHEGPTEAVLAIEDRAAWIRERGAIQFVLAGEDCKSDSLHRWMQATNVVRARPEVCYNHLRMRRRLEVVCGGRTADFHEPLPTFDTLTTLLSGMERELADTIEDEDNRLCPQAMGAERLAQLENSDIAQTATGYFVTSMLRVVEDHGADGFL